MPKNKRLDKVEVFKGKREWHWRRRAGNGEIRCSSEGFSSKSKAIRAAESYMETLDNVKGIYVYH